ncbi:MBL fold metallo-hydrolase [Amylibacter sp. SFDW26]|uniref:MBL fold metallo-hydrolase n=1 Tax=Amylibacter sp. SFDW26 TaxID=2652722 RepID=UPI0012629BBB|nr:MBL fold metallo-hydrolase [Amylibacter sp. SFDW26]KAB7616146.1 MBL fold metallo-hydrolase [Amylibacter sp. SFDW26]
MSAQSLSAQGLSRQREISHVTGDVYRMRDGGHYSLITVTQKGVVLVDPLNTRAAQWLKANLSQITDQPITHIIYSHSHLDHASGGRVFGETKTYAHEKAPKTIDGVTPLVRFENDHTFNVGQKQFELDYLGAGGHGEDSISVIVRPENVGFVVDVAAPKRIPSLSEPGQSAIAQLNQVKHFTSKSFTHFAAGHGRIGTHADAVEWVTYLESSIDAVRTGLNQGKSDRQIISDIMQKDADYRTWQQYGPWRASSLRIIIKELKNQ